MNKSYAIFEKRRQTIQITFKKISLESKDKLCKLLFKSNIFEMQRRTMQMTFQKKSLESRDKLFKSLFKQISLESKDRLRKLLFKNNIVVGKTSHFFTLLPFYIYFHLSFRVMSFSQLKKNYLYINDFCIST